MRPLRYAAILAVLALSAVTAPSASAASAFVRVVNGPAHVIDAAHPLTSIGARAPASASYPTAVLPTMPIETEHGDAVARRTGATYQADVAAMPKAAAASPNVATSQCASMFGSGTGDRVISHYEWCNANTVGYDVINSGNGQ